MAFSDHFKESDHELAKSYLRSMHSELEQARALSNKGDFITGEMHLRHALSLIEQLRILHRVHQAERLRAYL